VKPNSTSIAVVARDANGYVLKAWARCVDMDDPVIAEAFAIKWVLELAKEESFTNIIVESDSKIYIDSLEENSVAVCWKIEPLVSDVNSLALVFCFVAFRGLRERPTQQLIRLLVLLPLFTPRFPVMRTLFLPRCLRLGNEMCLVCRLFNEFQFTRKKKKKKKKRLS
jgi:hypothetical protein